MLTLQTCISNSNILGPKLRVFKVVVKKRLIVYKGATFQKLNLNMFPELSTSSQLCGTLRVFNSNLVLATRDLVAYRQITFTVDFHRIGCLVLDEDNPPIDVTNCII